MMLREFVKGCLGFLCILSLMIAVLGTVIGIGYGLYLWASVGVALKLAMWGGFKIFLLCSSGYVVYSLSLFGIKILK